MTTSSQESFAQLVPRSPSLSKCSPSDSQRVPDIDFQSPHTSNRSAQQQQTPLTSEDNGRMSSFLLTSRSRLFLSSRDSNGDRSNSQESCSEPHIVPCIPVSMQQVSEVIENCHDNSLSSQSSSNSEETDDGWPENKLSREEEQKKRFVILNLRVTPKYVEYNLFNDDKIFG